MNRCGKGRPWTPDEDRKLIDLKARKTADRIVAQHLKRSELAVRLRVFTLRERGIGVGA